MANGYVTKRQTVIYSTQTSHKPVTKG